jgi:hypothetical protein
MLFLKGVSLNIRKFLQERQFVKKGDYDEKKA